MGSRDVQFLPLSSPRLSRSSSILRMSTYELLLYPNFAQDCRIWPIDPRCLLYYGCGIYLALGLEPPPSVVHSPCPCLVAASPCIFSLTFICTSKNLETHRSKHTDSPLLRSPSRYWGGMHFLTQDWFSLSARGNVSESVVEIWRGQCGVPGHHFPNHLHLCLRRCDLLR